MLHTSKSQSILQWFNSLTTEVNVQSLSQFADGSHFCDIVSSVYSHIQLENRGLIAALVNTSTHEGADDKCAVKDQEVLESDVSISKQRAVRGNASKSETFLNESALGDASFIEVQKKYGVIKKFIDDFFHIESDSLIVYDDCIQGKELELAKVAILLLSALVQNFLSSGNQAVQTTTLLDIHVQEDIKECLSLIFMERDEKDGPLTKAEFHKVLSRPAKSKGTPRRRAPSRFEKADSSETPRNIPKKRQKLPSVVHEYVQESPLKELLQSPNTSWVYKAKMTRFKYETELSEIRKSLHVEESKNMDLTLEKRILSEELEKKKRELEFNKENHRQNLEAAEELTARKESEYLKQLEETEKIRSEFKYHVEEFKELERENKTLIKRIKDMEQQQSEKEPPESSGNCEMMEEVLKKISELETSLCVKEEKITELIQVREKLDRDAMLYRQMYEEEKTKRIMPMFSPRVTESISTIIYADERSARELLVEREKEINAMKIGIAALKKERDEIAALEKIRQKEIDVLMNRNKKETERSNHFESLYKADECQKQNVATVIRQLEKMQDDLDKANTKLSTYKEWEENVKNSNAQSGNSNPNILDPEPEIFPISASATSASSASPQFGQLWNTVPSENNLHTRRTKSSSVVVDRSRRTNLLCQEKIPNIYCSEAQFHDLKKIARSVVKWLQKQSLMFEDEMLKVLDQVTFDILSFCDIATFLQGLLNGLKNARVPISDVTHGRKRRSKAGEEPVINSADLQDHIKNMEKENETLKLEFVKVQENCKAQLEDKENDLEATKIKLRESEIKKEQGQKNLQESQKEVRDMNTKYECVKKYIERLKRENKRLLKLLLAMSKQEKELNEAKAEPCRDCEKANKKLTEVKEDLQDSELEREQLKAIVKDLEGKVKNLDRQAKELVKEKKKLEFQLERENAFMSGSASARNSVILRYFKQGMAESAQKVKAERAEKEIPLEQPRHVVSVNTYILHPEKKDSCVETSVSNNFANRSVRSGFLQTDDEEDFLNHSSLAQIHSGVFHDSEVNPEDRLLELHRRNTLCPPHLQSSYPLEVQNMTPSERKYYDLQRASLQPPPRKMFASEGEREFYRKKEAEFLGIEYEDSNDSQPFALKKRKISGTDATCPTTSIKRMVRKSSVTRGKVRTPVRRMGSITTKNYSFKTPSSIRRLMRMPRKNKQQ